MYFAPVLMYQSAFICFFLIWATSLNAQETPGIRNFRPQDYNAGNQNWDIAQSAEGWIFAGNNRGLLEFDGARWQLFSLPNHQIVRAVASGANGEIFCGGYAEFGYWSPGLDGRWVYRSLSSELPTGELGSEEIWHIEPCQGFVLFQTFSTIYKYDYHTLRVLRPPNSVMFATFVNGKVLVPVIDMGLYELGPDDAFHLAPGGQALAESIVQFIVPGPGEALWIGTSMNGLFELSQGQCRPSTHPLSSVFRQKQLNKGIRLSSGGWAIGTILDGIYLLDSSGNMEGHLNRENGLQNNTVLAMAEDRDGNLWLGLDRGLDRVALRSPFRYFLDQNGRFGSVFTAARNGQFLYAGTNQGVFIAKEKDNKRDFSLIPGTQGQVWQLLSANGLVLCGHNTGTFVIKDAVAHKISHITGGWHCIPIPGKPEFLLQSTYTGLVIFEWKNKTWQFRNRIEGFSAPLRRIAFDSNNQLWGAHPNKGLYQLQLDDELTRVLHYKSFGTADGLPSDIQLDLQVVEGQLVINTRDKAFRIAKGSALFELFDSQRIPRDRILAGLPGDIFLIDSLGLWLMNGQNDAFFIPLKLVPGYENIVPLDSAGEYLACLEDGYVRFFRSQLSLSQIRPVGPIIRRVESNGQAIYGPEPHEVPFSNNTLSFFFAVPSYERAPKFSWYLEGYSSSWSAWQEYPGQSFNNLPPGKYQLRVRTDGSELMATWSFRIAPPWYLSGWAITTYLILLVMGLVAGEQVSRKRLERQRRKLEGEKALELEQQRSNSERERLAIEVEIKTRELSNAALSLIRKNEVLRHLKDELLALKLDPRGGERIMRQIDEHLEGDHDWEIFEETFNRVHDDFFKRLQQTFSDLTPGDLRLAAYLRMNLSSKEIAPLLNISVRGVENKRYRLRKKMGLEEDVNLTQFILNF